MFKSGWLLIRNPFEFFSIPEKKILTSFVDSFTFKKILHIYLLLKKRINTSSLVQTCLNVFCQNCICHSVLKKQTIKVRNVHLCNLTFYHIYQLGPMYNMNFYQIDQLGLMYNVTLYQIGWPNVCQISCGDSCVRFTCQGSVCKKNLNLV